MNAESPEVKNSSFPDGPTPQDAVATPSSVLHVKLDVYDGPLDLLLELIKKNEMDIYDIPIAEITKQYLESLANMKKLDLEIAGEFIVMAATLIYIKSKMLLPQGNVEEDEDGLDPRAELARKLLEYQTFKEAAKGLGMMEGERAKIFSRQISDYYLTELDSEDVGMDAFSANLFDLLSAFQNVLAKSGRDQIHEVFEEVISIEQRIEQLKAMLQQRDSICFSELFDTHWTRNFLIVTFLALLEMMRTRVILVKQETQFSDILIQKNKVNEGAN